MVSVEGAGASGATAVSLAADRVGGTTFLALGHHRGVASLWLLRSEDPSPQWQRTALVKASHHDWESVKQVSVSSDGRVLLACTEDNIVLFSLPSNGDEPQELHRLHGADSQVSAASVSVLPNGATNSHIVAVAFRSGALEGWAVKVPDALGSVKAGVSWRLPRAGKPGLSDVVVAAAALLSSEVSLATAVLLVAGDAQGTTSLWRLSADGELLSAASPEWEFQPKRLGEPVLSLALHFRWLAAREPDEQALPQWSLAFSSGQEVIALSAESGAELHRGSHAGGIMALSWT
ncbi:unnamed protein product [Polarella glacialis]|uniref:Uncharacterized protein n=1 Tax=Polarella glacialis TaxID=89957 RepID=A0A813E4F3_POLGL|nr:unnamed protein product [Polarella glacialis]